MPSPATQAPDTRADLRTGAMDWDTAHPTIIISARQSAPARRPPALDLVAAPALAAPDMDHLCGTSFSAV